MRGMKTNIAVSQIETKVNVRYRLRPERVVYLTNLYRHGADIELIEVRSNGNGRFEVVRGRHRFAAVQAAGFEMCEVRLIKCSAKKAAYHAVEDNTDPTHLPYDDNEIPLNINVLLEVGYYKPEIRRLFKHIPDQLMTKYFDRATTIKYQKKVRKAVECCKENAKVDRQIIAKRFGVRLSSLLKALDGETKPLGLPEIKGDMTKRFGSLSSFLCNQSARLRQGLQEGEVTEGQLRDVSNHIQDRLKHLSLRLNEEHGRNENACGKC